MLLSSMSIMKIPILVKKNKQKDASLNPSMGNLMILIVNNFQLYTGIIFITIYAHKTIIQLKALSKELLLRKLCIPSLKN